MSRQTSASSGIGIDHHCTDLHVQQLMLLPGSCSTAPASPRSIDIVSGDSQVVTGIHQAKPPMENSSDGTRGGKVKFTVQ